MSFFCDIICHYFYVSVVLSDMVHCRLRKCIFLMWCYLTLFSYYFYRMIKCICFKIFDYCLVGTLK
jgi:hypothetical protein